MSPLGYGLVRLRDLLCDQDEVSRSHFQNEANVRRLERVFRLEGCNRYEPQNYVQVAIDSTLWQEIVHTNGLDPQVKIPECPSGWKLLDIRGPLRILHGRHRLAAAQRFFEDSSRKEWVWTVEFLDRDFIKNEAWKLHLDDKNSQQWSDGEIYRLMRIDFLAGNEDRARRLEARFRGPTVANSVRRLLFCDRHRSLLTCLDKLLPFVGLWSDFQPGCIHHFLDLRSPEVLENYWNNTLRIWMTILGTDISPGTLDRQSVALLEGTLPYRKEDLVYLDSVLQDNRIFSDLSRDSRKSLAARVKGLQETILSFGTFCKDIRWFEPPLKILRVYLPQRHGPSTARAYSRFYTSPAVSEKEISPNRWQSQPPGLSVEQTEDMAFFQLFAFCWRNFPFLSAFMPHHIRKGESVGSKGRVTYEDLYQHAQRLGFNVPDNQSQTVKKAISANLRNCLHEQGSCSHHPFVELKRRHGLPLPSVFEQARDQLFVDDILSRTRNDFCLAFEITRNIFKAFFVGLDSATFVSAHQIAQVSESLFTGEDVGGKRKRAGSVSSNDRRPRQLRRNEEASATDAASPTSVYTRADAQENDASLAQNEDDHYLTAYEGIATESLPWFSTELVSEHDISYYDSNVENRVKQIFGYINHGIQYRGQEWWREITIEQLGSVIIIDPSSNLICFIEIAKATAYLLSTKRGNIVDNRATTEVHTLSRGRILPVPKITVSSSALYVISRSISVFTIEDLKQKLIARFSELPAEL